MATFQLTLTNDVARVRVIGAPTGSEFVTFIREHYPLLGAAQVLWNFAPSDLSGISEEDMQAIAASSSNSLRPNPNQKIAFVVPGSVAYALLWRYITQALKTGVVAEYSVFMDEKSAMQWLRS